MIFTLSFQLCFVPCQHGRKRWPIDEMKAKVHPFLFENKTLKTPQPGLISLNWFLEEEVSEENKGAGTSFVVIHG